MVFDTQIILRILLIFSGAGDRLVISTIEFIANVITWCQSIFLFLLGAIVGTRSTQQNSLLSLVVFPKYQQALKEFCDITASEWL